MAIIVFQHSDAGRTGRLGQTLRDHAHQLDIRRLDMGDPVPCDHDGIEGVIVMGGPQNVSDDLDWMRAEFSFLKETHDRSIPLIGICLGAQLVAHALGGTVTKMDRPVVGFCDVAINPTGQVDTILSGIAWNSMQICTHGHHISTPPPGAQILAGSEHCACQIFRAGMRTYGFQFHFEADREILHRLHGESPEFMEHASTNEAEVEQQAEAHYATTARLGDRLSVNIATYLMPSATRLAV